MELNNEQKVTIAGLLVAVVIGGAVFLYNHYLFPAKPSIMLDEPKEMIGQKNTGELVVHVCGAVEREGVYKMSAGDRVLDAVKMAGGARPNANLSAINLAEEVKNGQKIVIAEKKILVADKPRNSATTDKSAGGIVNLNTASESDLDALPGVGPATAKKIIESRPFSKPEDIMKLPRFGKSKFEKIKDRVTV